MSPGDRSRMVGCLLGGAIGDALGAEIEFADLARIRREFGPDGVTGYVGSGPTPGSITDDTQMTLFTAEGLIRARNQRSTTRVDDRVGAIERAYFRWLATQGIADRFDPSFAAVHDGWLISNPQLHRQRAPGTTCLSGLSDLARGSPASPLNESKGCGGVMRVAPIGLVADDAFELAADVAALSHGHPTGYLAAGAFAQIIHDLFGGAELRDAIDRVLDTLLTRDGADETRAALGRAVAAAESAPASPETLETFGGGWIAEEALAIACFCTLATNNVRTALLLAVNHSGDSDSTGSIVGNLLGVQHGDAAFPDDLREGLAEEGIVEAVGLDLAGAFLDDSPADLVRYPPW